MLYAWRPARIPDPDKPTKWLRADSLWGLQGVPPSWVLPLRVMILIGFSFQCSSSFLGVEFGIFWGGLGGFFWELEIPNKETQFFVALN